MSRRSNWDGIVSARKARKHLQKLSQRGVDIPSAYADDDLNDEVLYFIYSGRIKHIHMDTQRRILARRGHVFGAAP